MDPETLGQIAPPVPLSATPDAVRRKMSLYDSFQMNFESAFRIFSILGVLWF